MASRAPDTPCPQFDLGEVLRELAGAVLLVAPDGVVSFANERACALLNCVAQPGVALQALLMMGGVGGTIRLSPAASDTWAGKLLHNDGRILRAVSGKLPSGGASVVLDDISHLLREGETARLDPLTGIPDRGALRLALGSLLSRGAVTVFLVALDRFKRVNDTVGHQMGDALLRMAAQRLRAHLAIDDVIARFGGDEFVIVTPHSVDPEQARRFAEEAIAVLGRSYVIAGHVLTVGASVGLAKSDAMPDASADTVLKRAGLALATAKAAGGGEVSVFAPEMDMRMQARRTMELDLTRALSRSEFALVYQPQFELENRNLVGFEALLRWHCASRGLVSPAEFIPVAEEIGLIEQIGEWVLRTACRTAARWTRPISIAVNLSACQLRNAHLLQTVTSALASAGLSPDRLELEITESALLEDTHDVLSTLRSLRALGVRFSMDDFGTGYSSLSYLQKFPFDKIKIDQSFVRDMRRNEEAAAIVRTIARLGLSLGMVTTAEGVETEEQLAAVVAEGCTHVQGYLTGRPMSSTDAAALIAARPEFAAA